MNLLIESIKNQRRQFHILLERVTRNKTGCVDGDLSEFALDLMCTEHRTGKATHYNYYFRGDLLGSESVQSTGYGFYINDFRQRIDNISSIADKYLSMLDELAGNINYRLIK